MRDWNAVITVREGGYPRVFRFMGEFGPIYRTGFFNVLAMSAGDIHGMMEALRERILADNEILSWLARLVPVTHTFSFQTREEFESQSKEIIISWVPELAGKSFNVRMHRRGFKGKISSWEEERLLDEFLLECLEKAGTPGHISFRQPGAVIGIETIGQWAGLSFWTRPDLEKYPFLRFETSAGAAAQNSWESNETERGMRGQGSPQMRGEAG